MTHFRLGARSPSITNYIDAVGERWENNRELAGVGDIIY